ncbi:hypothetical protein [Longispora albida]|uniref:hypothetical protein n=1 Tax=Longispora albida TaxID=203523 RepID=UPI0003606F51|nr:hypothetical protein [Longispora albida]
MILPHTLTLFYSVQADDPDGNPVRRPGEHGVEVAGFVQPFRARETGDGTDELFAVYFDGEAAPPDAWSAAVYGGTRFEVSGPPQRYADPEQTVAYWRVLLRRAR